MTAKEYFARYASRLLAGSVSDTLEAVEELFLSFLDDTKTICLARAIRNPASIRSVIFEVNNKWNRLVGLLEKHFKRSPLKRDAIIVYYQKHIPELYKPEAYSVVDGPNYPDFDAEEAFARVDEERRTKQNESKTPSQADVQGDGMSGYEEGLA